MLLRMRVRSREFTVIAISSAEVMMAMISVSATVISPTSIVIGVLLLVSHLVST